MNVEEMSSTPSESNPVSEKPLRLLLVEDDQDDAEIMVRQLRKSGLSVTSERVETLEQFSEALDREVFDLVLADYRLTGWTGMEAFNHMKKKGHDIPFILVTGMLGDETAVECIKRGVSDYVLKDRLNQLPLSVHWVLEEKSMRDARRRAEEEKEQLIEQLQRALAEVKRLSGLLPICASCKKIRDDKGYWNQIEAYIQEHSEAHFTHGLCPECAHNLYPEAFK